MKVRCDNFKQGPWQFFSEDLTEVREGGSHVHSSGSRRWGRSGCTLQQGDSVESGGEAQVLRLRKQWGEGGRSRRAFENIVKTLVIKLSEKGFKRWSYPAWLTFDDLQGRWGCWVKTGLTWGRGGSGGQEWKQGSRDEKSAVAPSCLSSPGTSPPAPASSLFTGSTWLVVKTVRIKRFYKVPDTCTAWVERQ